MSRGMLRRFRCNVPQYAAICRKTNGQWNKHESCTWANFTPFELFALKLNKISIRLDVAKYCKGNTADDEQRAVNILGKDFKGKDEVDSRCLARYML